MDQILSPARPRLRGLPAASPSLPRAPGQGHITIQERQRSWLAGLLGSTAGEECLGKPPKISIDLAELRRTGKKDNPHEAVLRAHSESGTVHEENSSGAQELEDKLLVGDSGGQRDPRHRIER